MHRSALLVAVAGVASGCTEVDGVFSRDEWALVETLSPHHVPDADPSNAHAENPHAIALGHALYHDVRISTPMPDDSETDGGVSCATCHRPTGWFSDDRGGTTSAAKKVTLRNTPTLLDVNHYRWFHWDGKADSLWQAITFAVEVDTAQDSNRLRIAHLLRTDPYYAGLYAEVFDAQDLERIADFPAEGKPSAHPEDDHRLGAWESLSEEEQQRANLVFSNFAKAMAAYVGQLTTGEAPFDTYVAGDFGALDDRAKRGLRLFVGKAGCIECHSGPHLTDNEFHNLGVSQDSPDVPSEDRGRASGLEKFNESASETTESPFERCGPFSDHEPDDCGAIQARDSDLGAFRTPSLRNVAMTAPYLHTGGRPDLEDVLRFYAWGGDDGGYVGTQHPVMEPLDLDDRDIADLAAFLETLTGELPSDDLLGPP